MERLDAMLIIPALPDVARRIVAVVSNASVELERVVDVVEHSPEITARLLGLANSAFYGGGGVREVSSLGDAVIRVLGLDATRSLALAFSLASAFNVHRCRHFDA